jgi:hypothetical protein
MKKLVAFAMILSLGLFCAVGCNKPAAPAKPPVKPPVATPVDKPAADAPAAKPAGDAAAPTEKAPEK